MVAFYHIAKTGGSSVMSWFADNRAAVFHYGQWKCFFMLPQHADLFNYKAAPPEECQQKYEQDAVSISNATSNRLVYVEFHAHTKSLFWDKLIPTLPQLRQRHEVVVTFTIVREPLAHMISYYRCFAPRLTNKSTTMPLEEWLRRPEVHGLQTRELTVNRWGANSLSAPEAGTDCNTTLATQRLQLLDFSCTTRWMNACMEDVAAVVEMPFSSAGMPHAEPFGSRGRTIHEMEKLYSADGQLPASLVLKAIECDQKLLDQEQTWVHMRRPNGSVPASRSVWLTQSLPGYCGTTRGKRDPMHQCRTSDSGSFQLSKAEVFGGWNSAGKVCAEHCRMCARCRFVSLSLRHSDCSWFQNCSLTALKSEVRGFRTLGSRTLRRAGMT